VLHYLDIRDELERTLEPLELFVTGQSMVWTLAQLEEGHHPPLEPKQAVLVVCNLGLQSTLAAYYLQAEGYAATSLEGGIARLRKERENHFVVSLEGFSTALEVTLLEAKLHQTRGIRQFTYGAATLEVWGMISRLELEGLLEGFEAGVKVRTVQQNPHTI
jgi:rhodanese-related sulfurtransferase